ncbi:MAG: LysE family transporter [Gemmatimonadetes bacterium]|nr:LysE family transporter [Gemmatimonadota bacterium]
MTTTIITALVLGTFAGLAPGPYTTMVAGTALEKGFKAGFLLALTPLVTDMVPMLFSALLLDRLGELALTMLGITGGAIVIVVGIRFMREHSRRGPPLLPKEGPSPEPGSPEAAEREPVGKRRQSALAGHVIASTLLNPAPWLFWLIIASPLLLRAWNRSPGEGVLFAGLIFLTNISTASFLAWLASHSRKLLNSDWQRRSLKFVGATLILAGSFLCWQATVGNFQNLIDQQEAIRNVVEEGISGTGSFR